MSLAIVVDMNLSPEWIPLLYGAGWPTVHWSQIGDVRATDAAIMAWAQSQKHVVFTHDLDFGTTLALTHAKGPSVVQMRTQNLLPDRVGIRVVAAIQKYAAELESGAIVVIDLPRSRVRILPL
jgi:predicted nuclease of predicted toxin-antitoxin system